MLFWLNECVTSATTTDLINVYVCILKLAHWTRFTLEMTIHYLNWKCHHDKCIAIAANCNIIRYFSFSSTQWKFLHNLSGLEEGRRRFVIIAVPDSDNRTVLFRVQWLYLWSILEFAANESLLRKRYSLWVSIN